MTTSKPQDLANHIQAIECAMRSAELISKDETLGPWARTQLEALKKLRLFSVNQLRLTAGIDYDKPDAAQKIIKEGSQITVLANHMDGMKGGKGVVTSYAQPAMLSDIVMPDGMAMDAHKWIINDESKLKSA